mgnify:FL=1
MTKDKSVIPEWQGPASQVLVAIGQRLPGPVWEQLTKLFPVGTIPHYFVLKSLGDVAAINPMEIVPSLKEVMARTLPILGNVKKDNLRWVFAAGSFNLYSLSLSLSCVRYLFVHNSTTHMYGCSVWPLV